MIQSLYCDTEAGRWPGLGEVQCHDTKFVSWLGQLEGQGGLCLDTLCCIVTEKKA